MVGRTGDIRSKRATPCVLCPFHFVCDLPKSSPAAVQSPATSKLSLHLPPPIHLSFSSQEAGKSSQGYSSELCPQKSLVTSSFFLYYPHFYLYQKFERQCQALGLLIKTTREQVLQLVLCLYCCSLHSTGDAVGCPHSLNLAVPEPSGRCFDPSSGCLAQEHFALSANGFVKCILCSARSPGCSGAELFQSSCHNHLPRRWLPPGLQGLCSKAVGVQGSNLRCNPRIVTPSSPQPPLDKSWQCYPNLAGAWKQVRSEPRSRHLHLKPCFGAKC